MESPMISPVVPQERQGMALPPQVWEMSRRVKIIRFGVAKEGASNPWQRLDGMFRLGHPVGIEEDHGYRNGTDRR